MIKWKHNIHKQNMCPCYVEFSDEAIEKHASTNLSTKARRKCRPSLPAPSL